jgi:hypothetical protein
MKTADRINFRVIQEEIIFDKKIFPKDSSIMISIDKSTKVFDIKSYFEQLKLDLALYFLDESGYFHIKNLSLISNYSKILFFSLHYKYTY